MEWVLRSPQIHNTFSKLGFAHANGYHINENCNATLELILHNILIEDKYLRSYRRSISLGHNIKRDLIPILINTKDDMTIELLIKILVNLTIPVECLLSLDTVVKTDVGRNIIYEINTLLTSSKVAITDHRVTKVVIDFLKKNADTEQNHKLSKEQCSNISNTLLFLRNILHIPEDINCFSPTYTGPPHTIQNQLLWNLFSQSIDTVLIKLMVMPEAINWGVTMVQLIALIYKDQHVTTLHKLLNLWLEASLSESSEDNESNTSPQNRGTNKNKNCEDSSPMLTSDPTSDSSDTGMGRKSKEKTNSDNNKWDSSRDNSDSGNQTFQSQNTADKTSDDMSVATKSNTVADGAKDEKANKKNCEDGEGQNIKGNDKSNKVTISENSDCGYGTQKETQEIISVSSNEDEIAAQKPIPLNLQNSNQRISNIGHSSVNLQERRRKKLVKRSKTNIINVQGLAYNTPTDDDISNVLKEFTVDFLLKGYDSLVRTLHTQILTNIHLEIDTSHFFWLVTYFLKFATQIELDLEHVSSVLSFDVVLYLTAEGVNLCEQFELAIRLDGNDLKPCIRRLHLVVTAIREFLQAIEVYKKSANICNNENEALDKLQMKMCESEELRSLLVLLLRHYNPDYHSKQYLQDLIVTNHILLLFLDDIMRSPEYKACGTMVEHIKQFASPVIMNHYGILLEGYQCNGEFVNDCVFTLMHHIGGELNSVTTLYQPSILKTFTSIWRSEFDICDDWTDLIEYVLNMFIKKSGNLNSSAKPSAFTLEMIKDDKVLNELLDSHEEPKRIVDKKKNTDSGKEDKPEDKTKSTDTPKWSEDELSSLSWHYMQCNNKADVIGEVVKLFKEDGIIKSRDSVIKELHNQSIISKDECDKFLEKKKKHRAGKPENCSKSIHKSKESRDDEIGKLCEQLGHDGKFKFLNWVQNVLLEICFAKIYLEKSISNNKTGSDTMSEFEARLKYLESQVNKPADLPVMSPVSYHSLLLDKSVPLVPWNCQQASICKDLKFLQLLHRLGFHMPVDSGKIFIRIPHFWTPDILYKVAGKISSIDTTKIKFSLSDISQNSLLNGTLTDNLVLPELSKGAALTIIPESYYLIHNKRQNHLATINNFTPMPGSSFATDDDIKKRSWLEVVKKSHEFKITLDLAKSIITNEESVPIASCLSKNTVPLPMPDVSSLILPTVLNIAQKSKSFDINLNTESDCCNNSACETASMASDLTRMYVSDEEDRPVVKWATIRQDEDRSSAEVIPEKRQRVKFSQPF